MENKQIIFLDMDGVLANFDKAIGNDISVMYEPKFFQTLEEMETGLNDSVLKLKEKGYTVKILSKACVRRNDERFKKQMMDKYVWIKEHIPCIDELDIIIQSSDECKGSVLQYYPTHDCYLLDDYSKNLAEWSFAGGKSIKRAKRIKSRGFRQVLSLEQLAKEGI